MHSSRRDFCTTALAGLALVPAIASAEAGSATDAARRRLGALARRTLPQREIDALLASEAARAAGSADSAALARLVRADFRARRTLDLDGVRFARAEVAAFLRA